MIAFEQNLPVLSAAENVSDKLEKQRKILLLENNITSDPVECNSDFIDGMKMWPKIYIGQVFSYTVSSKAFAAEYMDQYKAKNVYYYHFKTDIVDKFLVNNRVKNNTGEVLVKT